MKQSFTLWSFLKSGVAAEDILRGAAKIGYHAVEIVDDEALFPLVQQLGLELSGHRAFSTLEQGLNRKENHARILQEFESNLRLASDWNIAGLIAFSGNRGGLSDEEGVEAIAEGLSKMGALAQDAGVSVWLELLNSKRDHPDFQNDRTSFGVKVMDAVNLPNVKLLYDIYHMQVMEGDIINTIQTQHEYFGHYHTAGNPGRQNLDFEQEINYPPLFRAIRDTGYKGYIAHEFLPKGDPIAALKQAFDLCKTALG